MWSGKNDRFQSVWAMGLIAFIAICIYSNSFDCSFHFDDQHSIVENYCIHRFDLKQIFSTSTRPVLDVTLALNYYFGKLGVFGYHLVNLMLHVFNGVMLFFIIRKTVSMPSAQCGVSERAYRISLYASLIFIAHPIQTQAVTYIISRSSVMATSFYLVSMMLFVLSVQKNSLSYLAGAWLVSCLGMGTKPIVATLPAALVLYDYYFIADGRIRPVLRRYKTHLVMFSSLLVVFALNFKDLQSSLAMRQTEAVLTPVNGTITSIQYFMTQLHVVTYYIKLLFMPVGLNLDYVWPIVRKPDLTTAGLFLLLAGILVLGIRLFRKDRVLSFGIVWFFLTLSVTSSFVVIFDVIFEHRLYLPSIGFAVCCASLISRISVWFQACGKKREQVMQKCHTGKMIEYTVISVLVASMAVLGYYRNFVWKDDCTLWTDVIQKAPENGRAYSNLSVWYRKNARIEDSIQLIEKSMALLPDAIEPHINLGTCYLDLKMPEKALAEFETAVSLGFANPRAFTNMALACAMLGRLDQAIEACRQALRIDPGFVDAHNNIGICYFKKGWIDQAISEFRHAIRIHPNHANAHFNLGMAYGSAGNYQMAVREGNLSKSLRKEKKWKEKVKTSVRDSKGAHAARHSASF